MNLLNVLNLLREYKDIIIILAVIFLSLVEITPIKINPWTCLIRWVSHIQGLDKLNDLEKRIIKERYFDGKSQIEIANNLHISQAQVSRIEKKVTQIHGGI